MRQISLLAGLLLALPAAAQPMRATDVVTWRVRADRTAPGQTARVVLDAQIAPGWRLYALGSPVGIPLAVALDPLADEIGVGRLTQSAPQKGFDEAFASDYTYHTRRARVIQRVHVSADAAAGPREVTGAVRYAVCDDRVCLPPVRTPFRVALVVE